MVSGRPAIGGEPTHSRVGVVVTVLEAHFVGVRVRVRIMAMRVLVHDVIVLVRVMRMVVTLLTVRVLMAVRCRVVVELIHILSFLPFFFSALRSLRSR